MSSRVLAKEIDATEVRSILIQMPYADPVKRRQMQKIYDRRHAEKIGPAGIRLKNSQKYRRTGRGSHLRRHYGLTEEQLSWMLVEQGGECEICHIDISEKPCVDHNHETGKVRRLLCHRCNSCLAAIEKPGWLESAQQYLKAHA